MVTEYVYVSAIIDFYTRKIVGWATSRDLSHKFCLQALDIAVKREKPPKGVIHHSDRGRESHTFTNDAPYAEGIVSSPKEIA